VRRLPFTSVHHDAAAIFPVYVAERSQQNEGCLRRTHSDEQALKITDYLFSINGKAGRVKVRRAHMANSIGSEHQPPFAVADTPGGLCAATGYAACLVGNPRPSPSVWRIAAGTGCRRGYVFPQAAPEENALLDRGSQISQRQCAGCHERATRSSAPSYQEIATFYRRGFPTSAGNPDLRSRLASAATHPSQDGAIFHRALGSGLSLDDRIAVATWVSTVSIETRMVAKVWVNDNLCTKFNQSK